MLRPFTQADEIALHRVMNEPNILQYFPNTTPPRMERVQALIDRQLMQYEKYHLGWWAVVPQERATLIGWNGLQYLPETDEVEVGYLLSKQFWGRGYATEGARAAITFGFETLGLGQIIGLTHPENKASQNVLLKCGLEYVEQKEYFGMRANRYQIIK
jgi:RimJ/RimL family protein N-acetyltransferase